MGPVPSSPLVGREDEMAALVGAAADARAGAPRCVVVTGEAGIGKTRLVAEALATLDGARVLTGHAADMTTGKIPFGVLADTLRDLVRQDGAEGLTLAERTQLAPLLAGGTASGSVEPARIHSCSLDLLARMCADRLLVWVVEDLHWADAATRDLVGLAARTVRGCLLVVVTVRTDDPARAAPEEGALNEQVASLLRVPHATQVALRRLTPDQVRDMVRSLPHAHPRPDSGALTRLSDGVPFFVEELVAAEGHLERSTSAAALAGRTTRLGAVARRLVEAAAVGDGHLRISLVEQVVDTGPEEFDAALAEAVEGGVLTCDPNGDRIGFRHALLRETVNAATGPGARRDWHRRWAEVLEENPGVVASDPAALAVAEHWHHAGDHTRSVSAAWAALPAARRTGDDSNQMLLWHRILDGWEHRDSSSEVGRLTLRHAIGMALRHPIVADTVLEGFLDAADRHPLQHPEQLLVDVSRPLLESAKTGPADRSFAVRAALEVDWLAEPPDALTSTALTMLGGFLPASEGRRAEAYLLGAERIAEMSGEADRLLEVANARSHLLTREGRPEESIAVLEQALQRLEPTDVSRRLTFAGDLAFNLVLTGRHHAADAMVTEQLETTPHLETMPETWEHLVENAAIIWLCTGEWARIRQLMAHAEAWWPDDLRLSNLWLAHLDLLERGTTEERRWRDRLGGVPIPGGPEDTNLRLLLAEAAGLRGDLVAMRALIAPAWESAMQTDDTTFLGVAHLSRIEATAAAEDGNRPDRPEAADHLDRMADFLTAAAYPLVHDEVAALELAAQTERFHGRDPREPLEAALGAWAAIDHLPDVAATHVSLAEAHAAHGDRDVAREHLAEGRRLAAELGAAPLLHRVTGIVRHYGFSTRERRPAEVFTDREVEVLQLLAEGRTNKEIGQTLFISPRTASVHVSRIIAKTGAGNRTEAVANARRHGLLADS